MQLSRKIHLVGIGGIGVSALARFLLVNGVNVSGSDISSSETTAELEKLGVRIHTGKHKSNNVPFGTETLIYSPAVDSQNPEIVSAKKRKIKIKSYPEAIGELTENFTTITVSGSHGKSTTTALIALVLQEGYFDPTVVVGTKLKEFGDSNFKHGNSRYFVLEADEWNKSFLKYSPTFAVVTNIDLEHLDTYKNIEETKKTFADYLAKVPPKGKIVANRDDSNVVDICKKFGKKVVWYSVKKSETDVIRKILRLPGEHNLSNALAAFTLGKVLNVPTSVILHAISRFRGSWRRFEYQGSLNGVHYFDDYAHHPREIEATIRAARTKFPLRRIWCVFQPHQQQRLSYLWNQFSKSFDLADRVLLLPIYSVAGRETKMSKIKRSAEKLAHELSLRGKNAVHHASFEKAQAFLHTNSRPGDVVLIMGAGDIYLLSKKILSDY